jgi:hypothetical protein
MTRIASKQAPLTLPTNTTRARRGEKCFPIEDAFACGDLSGLLQLVAGIDPKQEMFVHEAYGDEYANLTLMAKAVLADAESGGCLYVPVLHRLGFSLDAVDRDGRTLLHFAETLPVFRYLVDHGVPVPDGKRDRLAEVMAKDGLHLEVGAGEGLAFTDHAGQLPRLVGERKGGAKLASEGLDPVSIPAGMLLDTLSKFVRSALADVSLTDGGMMESAGLVFSVAAEMQDCLMAELAKTEARARARKLERLGLLDGLTPFWTVFGQNDDDAYLSAQGFAAVRDSEAGEVFWLRIFQRKTLAGVNGEGGRTLLHLADDADVCSWLLTQGVLPDVADDEGRLPADVLPPEAAAVVGQAQLSNGLPQGRKTVSSGKRI